MSRVYLKAELVFEGNRDRVAKSGADFFTLRNMWPHGKIQPPPKMTMYTAASFNVLHSLDSWLLLVDNV